MARHGARISSVSQAGARLTAKDVCNDRVIPFVMHDALLVWEYAPAVWYSGRGCNRGALPARLACTAPAHINDSMRGTARTSVSHRRSVPLLIQGLADYQKHGK